LGIGMLVCSWSSCLARSMHPTALLNITATWSSHTTIVLFAAPSFLQPDKFCFVKRLFVFWAWIIEDSFQSFIFYWVPNPSELSLKPPKPSLGGFQKRSILTLYFLLDDFNR
jgi:hypothetical protein